jgi:hypothetical protein
VTRHSSLHLIARSALAAALCYLASAAAANADALAAPAPSAPNCLSSNPLGTKSDLLDLRRNSIGIFVGTVLAASPESTTFRVLRVFHGPERTSITIERNPIDGCSYTFNPGLTYLVSTFNNIRGRPNAYTFAGTAWAPHAIDHLRWLDYQDKYWGIGPWLASFKIGKLNSSVFVPESVCSRSTLSEQDMQSLATCQACQKRASRAESNLSPEFRRRKQECDECLPSLPFAADLSLGVSRRVYDGCPVCRDLDFIYRTDFEGPGETPDCEQCRVNDTLGQITAKIHAGETACGERIGDCRFVNNPKARADCDLRVRQKLAADFGLSWLAR